MPCLVALHDSGQGGGPSRTHRRSSLHLKVAQVVFIDQVCRGLFACQSQSQLVGGALPKFALACFPTRLSLAASQHVGTRREYLSPPHQNSLPGQVEPTLMCRGPLSKSNPGASVSFWSRGSCPRARVVSLSLFPTQHIPKARILVQRLEPDRVTGLVTGELVRHSSILPKHQLERKVSAPGERAVLPRNDPVQDMVQILNRDHQGVTSAILLRIESAPNRRVPAAVSLTSIVFGEERPPE